MLSTRPLDPPVSAREASWTEATGSREKMHSTMEGFESRRLRQAWSLYVLIAFSKFMRMWWYCSAWGLSRPCLPSTWIVRPNASRA